MQKTKKPHGLDEAFSILIIRRCLTLKWGGRWGSNPRQIESQSTALPTELRPP